MSVLDYFVENLGGEAIENEAGIVGIEHMKAIHRYLVVAGGRTSAELARSVSRVCSALSMPARNWGPS